MPSVFVQVSRPRRRAPVALFEAGRCPVVEITFRACTGSAGALAAIAWARRNDQIVASVGEKPMRRSSATVTCLTLWNLRAQARYLPGDTRPYELLTGCWDGID